MLEELKEANNYISEKLKKSDDMDDLEKYAIEKNIPIVSKEVAEFLCFIIKAHNIKNILEIGTAIGYSGILMARLINAAHGKLYTIEIDEERYLEARSNFAKYKTNNVVPILGDALDEIKKIKCDFDMVFIDASKGHYQEFFDDAYDLLNENGIVFIDNILFRGYVYKEYPKRYKTIVKRLDLFIESLYSRNDGDFVLLPFGDGVGLFRKHKKEK